MGGFCHQETLSVSQKIVRQKSQGKIKLFLAHHYIRAFGFDWTIAVELCATPVLFVEDWESVWEVSGDAPHTLPPVPLAGSAPGSGCVRGTPEMN